jgi:hypothetical protein
MPQLTGTGAGEHKSQLGLLLHQRMRQIEQLRSLLDLVDHHDESPFPQPKWFLMNKKTQLANQLGKGKRKTTN